jgi:hypothetical protein
MSEQIVGPVLYIVADANREEAVPPCTLGEGLSYMVTASGYQDVVRQLNAKLVARDTLLQEISNWLVCEAISTPADMAQSFSPFREAIDQLLGNDSAKTLLAGVATGLGVSAERVALDWSNARFGGLVAKPSECKHEWTDDGEFLQVCTVCGRQEDHDPKWRDMDTAPRDGTLLRLLVEFDEHSTEDSDQAPTIGANNFDHDGLDEWKFAGWCWTHDHFTEGKGTPVGWLPLMNDPVVITPHSPAEHLHGNYGALKNHCIAAIKASGIPVDDCAFDGPDLFALMIDLTKHLQSIKDSRL